MKEKKKSHGLSIWGGGQVKSLPCCIRDQWDTQSWCPQNQLQCCCWWALHTSSLCRGNCPPPRDAIQALKKITDLDSHTNPDVLPTTPSIGLNPSEDFKHHLNTKHIFTFVSPQEGPLRLVPLQQVCTHGHLPTCDVCTKALTHATERQISTLKKLKKYLLYQIQTSFTGHYLIALATFLDLKIEIY